MNVFASAAAAAWPAAGAHLVVPGMSLSRVVELLCEAPRGGCRESVPEHRIYHFGQARLAVQVAPNGRRDGGRVVRVWRDTP
jgi:hypothetical protein